MFDLPADILPLWVGVSFVSLAVLGVITGLPTAAPDADPLATTVDSVAASPHDARGVHPIDGQARVDSTGVTLVIDGTTAHASFARQAIVPVSEGCLRRVLAGVPPDSCYQTPAAFEKAVAARTDDTVVVRNQLVARHITWGAVDVTLVG